MSVDDYFGKLQPHWDELANYNSPPTCNCGLCTCNLGELFQQRMDDDRLHDFLYGINVEIFCHVHSSLLAQDLSPTLDRAYNKVLEAECLWLQTQASVDRDGIMSHVVQAPNRGTIKFDSHPRSTCSYCHKLGHDVTLCYAKN
ncbi:hypothetical protein LIER_36032 [Lithospermum erythrorhizon]|uniref:Uncharacterized protein n=1 Tax=Lithospermum erythrorhizon TaxID=34254 RepID=A0AAV3P191_LITER